MPTCVECGGSLEGRAPGTVYCGEPCRHRAARRRRREGTQNPAPVATVAPSRPVLPRPEQPSAHLSSDIEWVGGPVEEATRNELEAVDRAGTSAGRSALALARKIDAGYETGSALAALAKQHLAQMESALRGTQSRTSGVVGLQERRLDKLA